MPDQPANLRACDRLVIDRDTDATRNRVMRFLNAFGLEVGRIPFSAVASSCFTSGTMIATARGAITIEKLHVGDKVITYDNGLQVIRWIGSRRINAALSQTRAHSTRERLEMTCPSATWWYRQTTACCWKMTKPRCIPMTAK